MPCSTRLRHLQTLFFSPLITQVFSIPAAIVLASVATATAPAATLMVVKQYKAKGPVTDVLLPVVALDDAVGLVVFAISLLPQAGVALGMAIKAIELGPDGAIVRNITLFAVLIYEIVGPFLTKIALTKAGDIKEEGRKSARDEHLAKKYYS